MREDWRPRLAGAICQTDGLLRSEGDPRLAGPHLHLRDVAIGGVKRRGNHEAQHHQQVADAPPPFRGPWHASPFPTGRASVSRPGTITEPRGKVKAESDHYILGTDMGDPAELLMFPRRALYGR